MSMPAPGMAPGNPFNAEPTSFKYPVFQNCLFGIFRARGRIATGGRKKW
jgi:hypothetical protein